MDEFEFQKNRQINRKLRIYQRDNTIGNVKLFKRYQTKTRRRHAKVRAAHMDGLRYNFDVKPPNHYRERYIVDKETTPQIQRMIKFYARDNVLYHSFFDESDKFRTLSSWIKFDGVRLNGGNPQLKIRIDNNKID